MAGKLKHATTPYHLLWAAVSGNNRLIVSFIERKKEKARTVCINAALEGSTKEEASEWAEDLLDLAYHGAIFIPTYTRFPGTGANYAYTRYQAAQETEGAGQPPLWQGETFNPLTPKR